MLGLRCCAGFSAVAASRGHSLAAVLRLLPEGALARQDGPQGAGPRRCGSGLRSTGSVLGVQGLSSFTALGIFLDQGLNSCLLHWQADSLPLSHQRSLGFTAIFLKVYLLSLCLLLLPSHIMVRSREDGTFKEPDTKQVSAACSFYFNCQTTLWFLS